MGEVRGGLTGIKEGGKVGFAVMRRGGERIEGRNVVRREVRGGREKRGEFNRKGGTG